MAQECNIEKIRGVLNELLKELKEIQPPTNATVNINGQPSEIQNEEKRPSWWGWVKKRLRNIGKMKNEAANQASDHGDGSSQGGSSRGSMQNIDEDQRNTDLEIQKLQSDILQMKTAFDKLSEFQNQMSESLERDFSSNKLKAILKKTDSVKSRFNDLNNIRRKLSNLKSQIPSLLLKQSSKGLNITDSQTAEENGKIDETGSNISLPGLNVSPDFENSSAFEEVVDRFEGLTGFTQKLCLLSFAVFPENREVKRTMLMYWWIGEGFIPSNDSEKLVTGILDEFLAKGLLEAAEDERKLIPNSYKMEPHVHSVVINLAKSVELFNLYSSKGDLIMEKSSKHKVCLVKGSSLRQEAKTSAMQPKNLNTVFNSSERYPDFTFKWFPFMDSLRVLYLGRWERTAKRHIEVESTDFLRNMKALKNLRLASFQGISRIEKLENSICDLPNLEIFDLRACYNLEALPEDIGLLRSLVYLDVSECFMLDRMPKGIAQLSKLQVLKGFVISQSDDESNCAIRYLLNLRKLSITVNRYSFKVENLMESLIGLKKLESLKIAWGARFPEDDQKGGKSKETNEPEEKENQNKKEQEDEQVQKKGQRSQEKRGDAEEVGPEDGTSSKKEDENGDGRIEKADREKEKKDEEVKAESLKSDQVRKGNEGKVDPREGKEKGSQKGKSNVEEDGDKEKVDPGEGKKNDEVKAESMKSEKVVEEEKKTSLSHEATKTVQDKEEGDGDKGKDDLEEAKKSDEVKAESLKSEKMASPSREATGTNQNKPDDQKGENKVEGDGDKGKDDLKEGKKQDEVEDEKSKSEKVVEAEKKVNPPRESADPIQKKPEDNSKVDKEGNGDKGRDNNKTNDKSKMDKEGDGDKGKDDNKTNDKSKMDKEGDGDGDKGIADPEEGKKQEEVEAEKSKSEKVVEAEKKVNPPRESADPIQKKPDDNSKVDKEGNGDKGRDNNKTNDKSKMDKERDGDKGRDDNKTNDKSKMDKKGDGDGDKGIADPEEGKKQEEVEAEKSKSEKVVEAEKKVNPPRESADPIQKKPDDNSKVDKEGNGDKGRDNNKTNDKSKMDKEGDGDKGRDDNKTNDKSKMDKKGDGDGDKGIADPEEGKKQEEVEAEKSKSEKVVEGDEKTSPPQESKDIIQNNTDDKSKVEKEENGDKGKVDQEEGKKNDEVEAESSKSRNGVDEVKKAKPSGESADAIQNKADDYQIDNKQEEKENGEKEKVNLEEREKKDEIIAESSKPDKVIERDEKTNPPQESKDTIQEKPKNYKENNKVQEKGDGQKNGDDSKKLDGEEAKTQKSDKIKKFGKKVSFSENSIPPNEKKPEDLKRDRAMDNSKDSASRKPKWYKMRNETKKWIRGHQETTPKDVPKLPSSLKKLELECFPDKDPPSWLNPKNLDKLKKLSIRGGNLSRISDDSPTAENSCVVQILRLKYLHQFKAEWKDLHALFPKMMLLEKYKCPKVSFCPTDGNGVWRSQP